VNQINKPICRIALNRPHSYPEIVGLNGLVWLGTSSRADAAAAAADYAQRPSRLPALNAMEKCSSSFYPNRPMCGLLTVLATLPVTTASVE